MLYVFIYSARVDRQHNNFAANFDIDDKAKQAEEAMWQQSSVGWRTRALILTNTFSLSRQNETRKWELADMWEFCYKSSSSTVGSIDIRVLYFMQFAHKTAKVKLSFLTFIKTLYCLV